MEQQTEPSLAERLRQLEQQDAELAAVDLAAIERMIRRAERKLDRAPELSEQLRAA